MLTLLLAASALGSSPADAAEAAHADLARLPAEARPHQRFLSLYHVQDPKRLGEWKKALDFWCNSLSREGELAPLAEVRPGLWRLDLRDYRTPASAWEKLADADPYFHARVKLTHEDWAGGVASDGKHYAPGRYKLKDPVVKSAAAPWLPEKAAAGLVRMTQSQAPIVRADWWLVQTGQQADRKGTGYYDFLEVKDRADFQKAVGLDQRLAEALQKETRAIVTKSGVALNNRQIIRFASITGSYWVTLDTLKNTDDRNAARNLNGDFKHDAEEVYGTLPNGLFAFFLGDAAGKRQDSAPDGIASDGQAPGNDRRVHAGVSCVRCHVEGIRPVADWGRRVYRSPLALASPDYEKFRRLRRLYLSDLERWVKRDQADYAESLLKLTGLKPAEMARTFGLLHASYQEADLALGQAAKEAGYTKAHALAALKAYAATSGPLDPVLAGLLQVPDEPVLRQHYEEVFPTLMNVMRGFKP